jgi:hypothetical protein
MAVAYQLFRQFFSFSSVFFPFLFWKVSLNFLCLIFNVAYFELLEHGHPRRLRETEDPGYRQLRQSHARYSTVQCTLILQRPIFPLAKSMLIELWPCPELYTIELMMYYFTFQFSTGRTRHTMQ